MPAVTHAVIVAASTLFAGSHGVELDESVLHAMHTTHLQSASGQSPTITADEDMPANTDISSLSLTPTVVSEGIKPFKGGPQVGIVLASSGPTNVLLPADRLSEFRFTDTRNGGWLSQNPYWRGNINFGISNQSGSRSELRRNEQINGWQVMGGKFTLISEASNADRLNIIQVLTLDGAGATQGSAKPNEQLAIRRTGRFVGNRPEWEFFLIQTQSPYQPACTSIKFTQGEQMIINMTYGAGNRPYFSITKGWQSETCYSGTSQLVGSNRAGAAGRYFYGKLGVYATRYGRGAATVNWQSIFD